MEDDLDLEELSPLKKRNKVKKSYKKKSEESQQTLFVNYLRKTYPHIIWRANPEGIRLSIGQAVRLKKNGVIQRSLPDVEVFYPTTLYYALFIEMKKEDFKLRKENGDLYKNPHISEQLETLTKLNALGYYATFATGFEHAKNILDAYIECSTEKLNLLKLI